MCVRRYWFKSITVTLGTPEFLTVPSNTSVVSGGTVQLPCSGDGSPTPSLTWWRLEEGMANQIVTDGQYFVTFSSLLLSDASGLNEGLYYCNLSSVADTVLSESIFLDVLSEFPVTLPQVRDILFLTQSLLVLFPSDLPAPSRQGRERSDWSAVVLGTLSPAWSGSGFLRAWSSLPPPSPIT